MILFASLFLLLYPLCHAIESSQIDTFRLAGKLSAISYCPLDLISTWTCGYCKDPSLSNVQSPVSFNDSTIGVQGFIAVIDHNIVVSFRGTSNYENRKRIFNVLTTQTFPDALFDSTPFTHKGIQSSYHAVKDIVKELILKYAIEYPTHDLLFVGHSLGGAIATLAAIDTVLANGYLAHLRHASQIHLYTMGSPRIGNKIFASAVIQSEINAFRSVNYSDPIPHLPLRSLGYTHFPQEVFLSKNGSMTFCSKEEGEDDSCSNTLYTLPKVVQNLKYHGVYYGAVMGPKLC